VNLLYFTIVKMLSLDSNLSKTNNNLEAKYGELKLKPLGKINIDCSVNRKVI